MAPRRNVMCPDCEETHLVELEFDFQGWACQNAGDLSLNTPCNRIVSPDEFRELIELMMTEPEIAVPKSPALASSSSPVTLSSVSSGVSTGPRSMMMRRSLPSAPAPSPSIPNHFRRPPSIMSKRIIDPNVVSSNRLAVQNGAVKVQRAPFLDGLLSVAGDENAIDSRYLRTGFQPPRVVSQPTAHALEIMAKRHHQGTRCGVPIYRRDVTAAQPLPFDPSLLDALDAEDIIVTESSYDLDGIEPLYIFKPSESQLAENSEATSVMVAPFLCRFLRPHQREGVRFLAECVLGLRKFDGQGCILADDMVRCYFTSLLHSSHSHIFLFGK